MIIYMYLSRERERKPRTTNNSNVVDFLHWKNNKKRETLEEEKNREKVRDEFEQGWETEPVGFVSRPEKLIERNTKLHFKRCACAHRQRREEREKETLETRENELFTWREKGGFWWVVIGWNSLLWKFFTTSFLRAKLSNFHPKIIKKNLTEISRKSVKLINVNVNLSCDKKQTNFHKTFWVFR